MAEYLARVSWSKILEYREALRSPNATGTGSPGLPLIDQYGSNQPILDTLNYGDGLWLFTAPVFRREHRQRCLPPSILGRIAVTHRLDRVTGTIKLAHRAPATTLAAPDKKIMAVARYKYWRCGEPGKALPIHNAFALLKSLEFEGRHTRIAPDCIGCNTPDVPAQGPFGHLMQHFQSIRKLTGQSAARLQTLHEHVRERRTLFLSHRHDEAGKLVRLVAEQLSNVSLCWWDVESVPQSRRYIDTALADIIEDGIRQAGWFIAFITPGYAATRWTDDEWQLAQDFLRPGVLARTPTIVPIMLGGELRPDMGSQPPIKPRSGLSERATAAAIADALKERLTLTG